MQQKNKQMKTITLFLFCVLSFSVKIMAQTSTSTNWQLMGECEDAITKNAPFEERRKLADKVKKYVLSANNEQIPEYYCIGDLLKDSDDPKDVLEAVKAYDYFLHNTKKYGYNFPNDFPKQERSLSLLLISKYYYFWKTGVLSMDARFTIAEAVRWFDGSMSNAAFGKNDAEHVKNISNDIQALQKFKPQESNPQAYKETMEIINRYSGMFLCKIGDGLKYNVKKDAKKYYKDALALGYTEANEHLAKIDHLPKGGYGAFDYRIHRGSTFSEEYAAQRKAANTPSQRETDAYNQWWQKTYGKGGTQNSTTMPNNNTTQVGYKTSQSEADRHQKAMDQIYRDTYKQMEKSFKNN